MEAGLRRFIAHGNHDPLSGWEAHLTMPAEAQRFGGPKAWNALPFSGAAPPWPTFCGISYLVRDATANLASGFWRDPGGALRYWVLHCNVGGGPPNDDNYAPGPEDLEGCPGWTTRPWNNFTPADHAGPGLCIVYPATPRPASRVGWAPGAATLCGGWGPPHHAHLCGHRRGAWFNSCRTCHRPPSSWVTCWLELSRVQEEVWAGAEGRAVILRLNLTGQRELHRELAKLIHLAAGFGEPLREGGPTPGLRLGGIRENRTRTPALRASAASCPRISS